MSRPRPSGNRPPVCHKTDCICKFRLFMLYLVWDFASQRDTEPVTAVFRRGETAMHDTDEAIYSRFLADRREEDFRVLLERHRDSLTLFLYGYVHNMEDAEELMLDAFAEAAAGAHFSGRSSFKTWLFSVGKNLALQSLRRQRSLRNRQEDAAAADAPPPELDLLREERSLQLYQALRQLKAEYRQVLILLYFEEMSPEEAGRVMAKSRRQIYHLAERGRQALRERLERMGFDDAQYR